MIRRSRQFSLSPREECCDGGHGCKLMLTVCREPKKSRINAAGYLVFCLLAFCLLHSAFCYWCPRRDSNPEPTDYESAALTVELQGHISR